MSATPDTPNLLPDTLQWLPAAGRAEQLMILLHGWGASAADMAPLATTLRREFPQAALLAPQGFEPVDSGLAGRQWFSLAGVTEASRPARVDAGPPQGDAAPSGGGLGEDQTWGLTSAVDAVLPRLADWVRAAQQATGVGPAATALVGFSQGAILALELAQRHDGLAGRVLSFSGRYAYLPDHAPALTTLHFFHGATDTVIPAAQSRLAMERLAELQGDATIDIANGIGHELPPALVQCALQRLRTHIPHRTWMAAMGAVPGLAGQGPGCADD